MGSRNYTIQTKIERRVDAVFQAVVDPLQLQKYFVDAADGPLREEADVVWTWKEWGDYPVTVRKVIPNELIEVELDAKSWRKTTEVSYKILVRLEFSPLGPAATMLRISEAGWPLDEAGLKASHENCSGWTHMALCLKAWLEHGIDLR